MRMTWIRSRSLLSSIGAALLIAALAAGCGGTDTLTANDVSPSKTTKSTVKHKRKARPTTTIAPTTTTTESTRSMPTLDVTPPRRADCTPGYDPCIPPASDVDCAGGSGNGPAYAEGPVHVTGSDIYGLDYDGDGIGCE